VSVSGPWLAKGVKWKIECFSCLHACATTAYFGSSCFGLCVQDGVYCVVSFNTRHSPLSDATHTPARKAAHASFKTLLFIAAAWCLSPEYRYGR